jgi:alkanesulfonate monooxygenase SsuD/methylene tetrahydromethanopterin reductase-like flavin-dependent oxidoreductase (luciferase family)
MTTLGAVFLPQNPPERLRSVARAADEAGLDELWLWESGVAAASAALAWTDRLRVGVGLLPVPLRNVAIAAMEMATMHRLFPGRAIIAVGHGVQSWMGQVGARVESPVTLLREHLDTLHALLRGEEVTVDGRYVHLDAVKLVWPPVGSTGSAPPAIVAGATGPRSIRLCGSAADGTLLTASTTAEGVRAARVLVDEGRAAAGRTDPHPISVYLTATTGPGAGERLAAEFARQGYDADLEVGVAGSAEEVAEVVRRYAAAGADTVVLQPTEDEPDPEAFVRFAATEVAPLVRDA